MKITITLESRDSREFKGTQEVSITNVATIREEDILEQVERVTKRLLAEAGEQQ